MRFPIAPMREVRAAAFATPLRTAFGVGGILIIPLLWYLLLGSPVLVIIVIALALTAFDYLVHSYWAIRDRSTP